MKESCHSGLYSINVIAAKNKISAIILVRLLKRLADLKKYYKIATEDEFKWF